MEVNLTPCSTRYECSRNLLASMDLDLSMDCTSNDDNVAFDKSCCSGTEYTELLRLLIL